MLPEGALLLLLLQACLACRIAMWLHYSLTWTRAAGSSGKQRQSAETLCIFPVLEEQTALVTQTPRRAALAA